MFRLEIGGHRGEKNDNEKMWKYGHCGGRK